ncbi:hypothetical protein BX600DRAFT_517645 [Xylariales sp. PMI_506]|nr:hypothetical protein BX600DRAFT_517645 [Xylariales sp. PMI_506]
MKSFFSIVSLSLLAINFVEAAPNPDALQYYTLSIQTTKNANLNGQPIAANGARVGALTDGTPPAKWYVINNNILPGLVSIHMQPNGFEDHALALNDILDGLSELENLVNPSYSLGAITHWNTFTWERDGTVSQDLDGYWIALSYPNGWEIQWYNGRAIIPQNYVVVNITYTAVSS